MSTPSTYNDPLGDTGTGTAAAPAESERSRGEFTETARDQARRVAGEAKQQAGSIMRDARHHAVEEAEQQTNRLSEALRQWSRQADALIEGRQDDAGDLGVWARQASSRLHDLADDVERLGFRGLLDEAQRFARRRPGAFLAGAAAAGFGIARLGRGAQGAARSEDQDHQPPATLGLEGSARSEERDVPVGPTAEAPPVVAPGGEPWSPAGTIPDDPREVQR